MYWRQHGDHYGIGYYRHEPLPGRARGDPAARGRRSSGDAPVHRRALRRGPRGGRPTGARACRRPDRRLAFNGLMAFPPDGCRCWAPRACAASGWARRSGSRTRGGAGRALADLMVRGHAGVDLHECDPDRFERHGTSRAYWRARGAQQYREVYDVIHPRSRASRRGRCGAPRCTTARSRSARTSSRAPAGSGRSGSRPTRRWRPTRRGRGATGRRATGRRSPWASTRRCASASGCSTSRRSRRSRCTDPGALALSPAPGRQRRRPAGRRDRLHRDALAARDDHVRPDDHAHRRGSLPRRHRRRGGSPRHGVDAAQPARGRLGRARGPDVGGVLRGAVGATRARRPGRARRRRCLQRGVSFHAREELHVGYVPVRALRISYVGELGWELYAPSEFGATLWDSLWAAGRARHRGRRRRGLRLAAPREGLPALGPGPRRGARPVRGRSRLGRATRQG